MASHEEYLDNLLRTVAEDGNSVSVEDKSLPAEKKEEAAEIPEKEPETFPKEDPVMDLEEEPDEFPEWEPVMNPEEEPGVFSEWGPVINPEEESGVISEEEPIAHAGRESGVFLEEEPIVHAEGEPDAFSKEEPVMHAEEESEAFSEDEPVMHAEEESEAFSEDEPVMHVEEESEAFSEDEPVMHAEEEPVAFSEWGSVMNSEEEPEAFPTEELVIDREERPEAFSKAEPIKAPEDTSGDIDMSDIDALLGAITEKKEAKNAPVLEDLSSLSEDDIEQILENSRRESKNSARVSTKFNENNELRDMLENESDDNLSEISELLKKSDNNEAIDEAALDVLEKVPGTKADDAEDLLTGDDPKSKRALKAAERKAKREAKKEARQAAKLEKKSKAGEVKQIEKEEEQIYAAPIEESLLGEDLIMELGLGFDGEAGEEFTSEEGESKGKKSKKNFFTKILDFLTEEEELESLNLSDENESILKEMDMEDRAAKKTSKKKKKKGKVDEEEDGEEKKGKSSKKEKKPKKEKSKKEKKPKLVAVEPSGKKLSTKKVIMVALVGATIAAGLLIMTNLAVDYVDKGNAREAFESGSYQESYLSLYGKRLNESEKAMFYKSENILRAHISLSRYEQLISLGNKVEALDELIQFVYYYPELYENAVQWNAANEVQQIYLQIIGILQDSYSLSEAQVLEIAEEPNDVTYTLIVTGIAEGSGYQSSQVPEESNTISDLLPEEAELLDTTFLDDFINGYVD